MSDHFIHYLKREITTCIQEQSEPFYATDQHFQDGFDRPMYHITRRSSGPVRRIKNGSVIWLFSSLKSPWGTLPPSLDAKFVVERIEFLSDGRTKFCSNENSKWFPLTDASKLIDNLKTIDTKGREKKLREEKKSLGMHLQSIRELSDPDAMLQWADRIQASKFDFISYRIKDGTKRAFFKVRTLMEEGKIVFWDRYSLPRRLVERREIVDNEILNEYLMSQINLSSCVWGIESPKYAETASYSLKEALLAKQLNKYLPVS
jgi:hypothetical protein